MKAKRKRHDNAFKGRVALEALNGIKSIQAIAKEFDLHPMQVSEWKRKLKAKAQELYPHLDVTLKNCDALLILHFALGRGT